MRLHELTAAAGAAEVRAGRLRPSEWSAACMRRIAEVEPRVHAWHALDYEVIGAELARLDVRDWAGWAPEPVLAGLPLGVKDVFNTEQYPTHMGSRIWQGFTPGNDARVVSRARLLGAVVLGKTETAEFATHHPGETRNPHSGRHIAGTSSTGSAVAVACGMVPAALGTQTAGSIIRPASYIGVIGFKPSFGLIPRTGVLKTADTLDTIGWFARSVTDIRLVLDALRVRGRDYPAVERGLARAAVKRDHARKLRLAVVTAPSWELARPYARDQIIEYARQVGNHPDIDVEELDLRALFGDAHDVHRTIYHKQLAYWFHRELRTPEQVSDIFREITEEGSRISKNDYLAAITRQRMMEHQLDEALAPFDALVTLSTAGQAPGLDEGGEIPDSALVWTLCGAPGISLPLFTGPDGLPFGAQLVAPRYGDYTLLDLAERLFPGTCPIVEPVDEAIAA